MPAVLFEKRDHVALITINRPDARNAVNPEVAVLMTEAWQRVRDEDDIRCAVVTGTGDSFCSGADLKRLITLVTGARQADDDWDAKLAANPAAAGHVWLRDYDPEKPIIAAVNGFCIAGGLELTCATDIRVAAEDAVFGLQEAKWGLFPLGASTIRLPWAVPFPRAMEIALTARQFTAAEAYEWGLLNKIVPRDRVVPEALHYAEMIAENAPLSTKSIRKAIRSFIGLTEAEALPKEQEIGFPCFLSEDAKEGPRAFKEKRRPNFKGR